MQHIAITVPGRATTAPLLIECDRSREGVSLAVEALITLLDQMDGDPDRELDEPDAEHDGAEPDNSTLFLGDLVDRAIDLIAQHSAAATPPDALPQIEAFLQRSKMPYTKLGRLAAGDPRLVHDMRLGRQIGPDLWGRVERFMQQWEGPTA